MLITINSTTIPKSIFRNSKMVFQSFTKHNKLKHNKFKRIEIIQCLLIDHSKIKLEMNNRNWKIGQPSQMEIKHHTSK